MTASGIVDARSCALREFGSAERPYHMLFIMAASKVTVTAFQTFHESLQTKKRAAMEKIKGQTRLYFEGFGFAGRARGVATSFSSVATHFRAAILHFASCSALKGPSSVSAGLFTSVEAPRAKICAKRVVLCLSHSWCECSRRRSA
jgi:hypothetical protein